uniref:RING-type domain-containing protein n=1 Tax=Leersia perrieri TaxID=77586 RepID=A0A0D9VAD1_9ORYZ
MAAAAAAASSSSAATTLPMDKAAAAAAVIGGGERAADCGVCAICLDKIALQETALVKGCDHAYCVTCILRWASYKEMPLCPQCKHPFDFLSVHRSLDGCIHDYLFEESVCLLLRATWFEPLMVEAHEEALDEEELYHSYQYDVDEDDLDEEAYYMSRSPSIRIGNRRWGDNGFVRGGRKEARPVMSRQSLNDADAGPSRTPKKKDVSASGSGSVSKEVAGRRAKRAQKREAADKAAAEKHLKHLQRLGLRKAPEASQEVVEPQLTE